MIAAAVTPPVRRATTAGQATPGRRLGRLLLSSGLLLALTACGGGHPETSPLNSDDLDALTYTLAGTELEEHAGDQQILEGTTPHQCGIVAQFGTGTWAPSDVESGESFYQLWGEAAGEDAPWINSRLFTSPEAAER